MSIQKTYHQLWNPSKYGVPQEFVTANNVGGIEGTDDIDGDNTFHEVNKHIKDYISYPKYHNINSKGRKKIKILLKTLRKNYTYY